MIAIDKDNVYYNKSGYYDPTAGDAITKADKAKRRGKIRKPKPISKGKAT